MTCESGRACLGSDSTIRICKRTRSFTCSFSRQVSIAALAVPGSSYTEPAVATPWGKGEDGGGHAGPRGWRCMEGGASKATWRLHSFLKSCCLWSRCHLHRAGEVGFPGGEQRTWSPELTAQLSLWVGTVQGDQSGGTAEATRTFPPGTGSHGG